MRITLSDHEAVGVVAANPGPLTLGGTNTWVVGSDEAWVIDPGPSLDDHVAAVAAEVTARGSLGGIALTHQHSDHSEAVDELLRSLGEVPVVAFDSGARHGQVHGPLEVFELPGHCGDHVAFVSGSVAFTGDALFAESSVFISPGPGSMSGYLAGLEALADLGLSSIAPGHGPVIDEPAARIAEQVAHRLDRERRLVEALASGRLTVDELLAEVWDDVPVELIPAAAVTLAAHLGKLDEEDRLPEGVEWPEIPDWVV